MIPILVQVMDLSYYHVGLLGFGLLITVVVQYIVGRIADRAFSRYLLEFGAAMMGTSFVLLLFVSSFTHLFLAVILMRVGGAFYHPVGTSWITREYAGPYVDTALGVQSGVGNFGVILALGTSGFLGEAFGWQAPCIVWAGLNFAAVIIGLVMIEEGGNRTTVTKPARLASPKETLSKMWMFVIPIITGGALYQVTSYFGPTNLTKSSDWTAGGADLMFAVWIGVGTVTSYYFGAMSHRYGKDRLLSAGYLVSAASVLTLAFTVEWYLVAPALIIFGALLMLTYPALFSYINQMTGEGERGTAFGILFGFQLGGGAALVYICGIVADLLGNASYAFVVVAALSATSFLIVTVLNRKGTGARA